MIKCPVGNIKIHEKRLKVKPCLFRVKKARGYFFAVTESKKLTASA